VAAQEHVLPFKQAAVRKYCGRYSVIENFLINPVVSTLNSTGIYRKLADSRSTSDGDQSLVTYL
jgi:hypothetical protein